VQASTGSASLTASHSAFATLTKTGTCAPSVTAQLDTATHDVRLVDRAGGDLRPQADSPLVDAGATVPAATELLDFAGAPRLSDGNADGTATVDIGALEYQAPAPVVPPIPGPTQPQADEPTTPGATPGTEHAGGTADPTSQTAPEAVPVILPSIALAKKPKGAIKRTTRGFAIAKQSTATTTDLDLSGATSLVIDLQRSTKGVLVAGNGPTKCLTGVSPKDGPACTRLATVGKPTILATPGASAHVRFGGGAAGHKLPAGTYRVTITPARGDLRGKSVSFSVRVR
jgi:hypothetical protein